MFAFNKIKTALKKNGSALKQSFYFSTKTGEIIIDNVKFEGLDLSQTIEDNLKDPSLSAFMKDVEEVLITAKFLRLKKNGKVIDF